MVSTNLMKLCAKLCVLCVVPSLLLGQRSSPTQKPGANGTFSQPTLQDPTSPRQQPETPKAMGTPASSVAGQSTASIEGPVSAQAPAELGRGVVIEAVKKNSEAEKAGLQEGDTLLHWARGAVQGEIESPFDLSWIEIEQAPRGAVTIEGLRGTDKKVWTLGPESWSVNARPSLSEVLLSIYLEGKKLGSESLMFADALAGIGGAAVQRRDLMQVEKFLSLALEIQQRLAPGSLIVAKTVNGLGDIARARGDLSKAEEYYRQAFIIRERLAPGSLDLAASLNNLGVIAKDRGDLAKAAGYYRQALSIRAKLAPDSLDLATTLNYLA